MFEYDEIVCQAAKTLDKYSFVSDILSCRKNKILSPYDIREYIALSNNCEVQECLEEFSIDEFMEYFTVNYGVYWDEIIEYQMR